MINVVFDLMEYIDIIFLIALIVIAYIVCKIVKEEDFILVLLVFIFLIFVLYFFGVLSITCMVIGAVILSILLFIDYKKRSATI